MATDTLTAPRLRTVHPQPASGSLGAPPAQHAGLAHAGAVAERFYTAFSRRDGATMQACYHPEVHFTDPVFDLHGVQAGDMWRMLTESARDFRLQHQIVKADAHQAEVAWEAWYVFSGSGRQVHNRISTHMEMRDGLIWHHEDHFDFWGWSRQALGPMGLLMGWSPWLRQQVHQQALAKLEKWQDAQATEASLDKLPG